MIMDERLEFADATAVTGAAATRLVGDVINLQQARDIGNGQPVYAVVQVVTAPTGADTVKFQIVSDAQAAIATDGTQTIHAATDAEAIADLPVGTTFVLALPLEGKAYEQYLGFQVVNAGATALASLEVNAFLTLDPHGWQAYPDAAN